MYFNFVLRYSKVGCAFSLAFTNFFFINFFNFLINKIVFDFDNSGQIDFIGKFFCVCFYRNLYSARTCTNWFICHGQANLFQNSLSLNGVVYIFPNQL